MDTFFANAALLRRARGEGPDDPERQRPRVLRPAGQAPLRALPAARGDRAPHHEGRQAQSNGFIERFHRTLLEEHLRIKGRTTWYETVAEMQKDLDAYLETYNHQRPHRGRGMKGRNALRGLQGRDPEEVPDPEEAGQKGGQDRSVDLTSTRAGCQVNNRTCTIRTTSRITALGHLPAWMSYSPERCGYLVRLGDSQHLSED